MQPDVVIPSGALGDTLTVLDAGWQQIKVRLAEIDAPEKKQGLRPTDETGPFRPVLRSGGNHREQGPMNRYGRTIGLVALLRWQVF